MVVQDGLVANHDYYFSHISTLAKKTNSFQTVNQILVLDHK